MGSRRVPGFHMFRHQFMVLVPENIERFKGKLRDLGGGTRGMVVGGYVNQGVMKNIFGMGKITYHRNNMKDRGPLKKYLRGDADEDAALYRAHNKGLKIDDTIEEVMSRGRSYRTSAKNEPIKYPSIIKNMMGWGENSNSFIQTLADTAGIKNRVKDHPGIDSGAERRLPENLFAIKEGSAAKGYRDGYLDGYLSKTAGDDFFKGRKPITGASPEVTTAEISPVRSGKLKTSTPRGSLANRNYNARQRVIKR